MKGQRRKKGPAEGGRRHSEPLYLCRYKMHALLSTASEMMTGLVVTDGNTHDGKHFPTLVERATATGACGHLPSRPRIC